MLPDNNSSPPLTTQGRGGFIWELEKREKLKSFKLCSFKKNSILYNT